MDMYTQSSSVITVPMGNMYLVSSKKVISRPTISEKKPIATAPRAAPSSVMMLPDPAV